MVLSVSLSNATSPPGKRSRSLPKTCPAGSSSAVLPRSISRLGNEFSVFPSTAVHRPTIDLQRDRRPEPARTSCARFHRPRTVSRSVPPALAEFFFFSSSAITKETLGPGHPDNFLDALEGRLQPRRQSGIKIVPRHGRKTFDPGLDRQATLPSLANLRQPHGRWRF